MLWYSGSALNLDVSANHGGAIVALIKSMEPDTTALSLDNYLIANYKPAASWKDCSNPKTTEEIVLEVTQEFGEVYSAQIFEALQRLEFIYQRSENEGFWLIA